MAKESTDGGSSSKMLVLGPVAGQFKTVFSKLSKLQAKTPFPMALVAGDLFADPATATPQDEEQLESLLSGEIEVPLPVYFTTGRHPFPPRVIEKLQQNENSVCANLSFLGKRSIFKTVEGIRIVLLGGVLDPNVMSANTSDEDAYTPLHLEADAKVLNGAHNADVLVTTVWPAGVTSGSQVALPQGSEPTAETCVADLCAVLKPRYHFSASPDAFYEREPFYFPPPDNDPSARPFTRFISLGSVASASKAKWLYAFNIEPSSTLATSLPAGATPSPFVLSTRRKRPSPDHTESFSRFDHNDRRDYGGGRHKRRRQGADRGGRQRAPPTQAECFFCLSNPNLSTHLIAAIGDDSYLTTSKGPVPTSSTFAPALDFPAHILIIPLAHAPTIASIQSSGGGSQDLQNAFSEMQRYRRALNSMLKAHGHGDYGSVCWEISKQDGVHVHWQWMPADAKSIAKGLVEAGFRVEAENTGLAGFERRAVNDGVGVDGDWFRVWLWRPKSDDEETREERNGNITSNHEEKEASNGDDNGDVPMNGTTTSANGNGTKDVNDDVQDVNGIETQLFLPLSLSPPLDSDRSSRHKFDLQFGRRVMAKLLGTPGRAHWKDCVQSEEEERREVGRFKEAFRAWDFSG